MSPVGWTPLRGPLRQPGSGSQAEGPPLWEPHADSPGSLRGVLRVATPSFGAKDTAAPTPPGSFPQCCFLHARVSGLLRSADHFYKAFQPLASVTLFSAPCATSHSSLTCAVLPSLHAHVPTLAWPQHSLYHSLWTGLSKSRLSFLIHLITSRSKVLNMSILQISNSPHRPQVPSQSPGLKSYAVHVPPALCVRVPCTWASFRQRHTLFLYSLFCCSFPLLTPILSRPMFFPFPLPPTSQIFSFLQDPAQGHPPPDASLSVPHCPSQAEVMQ